MNINQYYESAKHTNENGGGWASLYYGVFSKIIKDNEYLKCAEVGVGFGLHAKDILKNTSAEKLYLIDPMKWYPNDDFAKIISSCVQTEGKDNFDVLHERICQELSPWSERWVWFRKPSVCITEEEIPSESLDAIFIDGDHSYEGVIADLNFWWSKLRKGGQLLGDDIWLDSVLRAVNEFSLLHKIPYDLLQKEGTSHNIYRFKK
jgi:hypothetical protein